MMTQTNAEWCSYVCAMRSEGALVELLRTYMVCT